MSDFFANKFKVILEAEDDLPTPEPVDDEMAPPAEPPMPTEPAADDDATIGAIDDVEPSPVGDVKKAEAGRMKEELNEVITKVHEFTEYLNGTDGDSLQRRLNTADCDTLFAQISRSETKKISRIAQDLSALVESLKGYILSAEE